MFEVSKEDNIKPDHIRWNSIIPIAEDYFLNLKNKNAIVTKENIDIMTKFLCINQIEFIDQSFQGYEWSSYIQNVLNMFLTPIFEIDSSSLYVGTDNPEFIKELNNKRNTFNWNIFNINET